MLLTRIELVIALYQSAGIPLTYKSYGTPPPTRTGNTLLLREPRLPIAPVGFSFLSVVEQNVVTVAHALDARYQTYH